MDGEQKITSFRSIFKVENSDHPIIELKNCFLAWKKNQRPLLENVCLPIFQGKSLVLIGPSGFGKSSILKMIAGLIEPTEGSILYSNRERHEFSDFEWSELTLKIGMLFQKNALFDFLTVGENIAFPLRERTQLSESEILEIVDNSLHSVGIGHARDLYPDEISGGMQKRLGIARALALQPEVLLYDDPTAGLDPITSRKIAAMIRELQHQQKTTLVVVTNDMNRAYELGDTLAFVAERQVLLTGTPAETKAHPDPRVQQFILGKTLGPLSERHDSI